MEWRGQGEPETGRRPNQPVICMLLLLVHSCIWDSSQVQAKSLYFAAGGPNGGWYQQVSGAPDWLTPYLEYDDVGGYWEIHEGVPGVYLWTPLRNGDRVTLEGAIIYLTHRAK
jgi:hypothetical protein